MLKIKRREFIRKLAALGKIGIIMPFLPKSLRKEAFFIEQIHAGDSNPVVVSVRDTHASDYDHNTGYFWEHVNQQAITNMVNKGVMALTGTFSVTDAWRALIPYSEGENVLMKLNFNNSRQCDIAENAIDPIPETVNAVIEGLTNIGIPDTNIMDIRPFPAGNPAIQRWYH